jgi:hypothetical protein
MSLGHHRPDSLTDLSREEIARCRQRARNAYAMDPDTEIHANLTSPDHARFHSRDHGVDATVTVPLWVLVAKVGTSYRPCQQCVGGDV